MQTPNSAPARLPERLLERRNHDFAHRSGQHRAANDHHRRPGVVAQRRADLLAYASHVLEIDAAVGQAGRADADERELGVPDCSSCIRRRRQAARRDLLLDDLADVLFDDGSFAGVDQVDLARLGVYADDLMAFPRQTARGDGTDIAEAHDADLHRLKHAGGS